MRMASLTDDIELTLFCSAYRKYCFHTGEIGILEVSRI